MPIFFLQSMLFLMEVETVYTCIEGAISCNICTDLNSCCYTSTCALYCCFSELLEGNSLAEVLLMFFNLCGISLPSA